MRLVCQYAGIINVILAVSMSGRQAGCELPYQSQSRTHAGGGGCWGGGTQEADGADVYG